MAQTMVANGAGMNPSESPYSEGDKVIIPQQSLVYEAKVGSENGEEAGDLDDDEGSEEEGSEEQEESEDQENDQKNDRAPLLPPDGCMATYVKLPQGWKKPVG